MNCKIISCHFSKQQGRKKEKTHIWYRHDSHFHTLHEILMTIIRKKGFFYFYYLDEIMMLRKRKFIHKTHGIVELKETSEYPSEKMKAKTKSEWVRWRDKTNDSHKNIYTHFLLSLVHPASRFNFTSFCFTVTPKKSLLT